jgi:hypothetical protein
MRNIEINEKTHSSVAEFQVGKKLRGVERQQFFHCFEFHDHAVFDKEIDSVPGIKLKAFIKNGQTKLVLKLHSSDCEFVKKASGVGAFKQSRSERSVYFKCRLNDSFGHVFMEHEAMTSVSSVSSVVEICWRLA